ncbi:claudin-10-like [Sphaeramia orbicularis]|uniref:Claudin n=1 Tax=Sphaeramia orbicularis TaxID=375764 RepID=A0A673C9Z8_9TELE|nr:claudin-10-like [Sphaeramia orbicularis]
MFLEVFPEILGFILTTSGWILVSSTLHTDYWKIASLYGTVINTNALYSNLWKLCVTDSAGTSDCKGFPSMLALDGYIQACRGLMISAVCLGFFGSLFALIGMKCTKIGGSDKTKARIACIAGVIFILSGFCSFSGCSVYAFQITSEFFDPMFMELKYDFGVALFVGWGGSVLCISGGSIFCYSIKRAFTKREELYNYKDAASHSRTSSYLTGQAENITRPPSDDSKSSQTKYFERIV